MPLALGRPEWGAPVLSAPDFDVAVIGLGPTGAVLANLLAECGLSVVVFERDRALHDQPRAVHFDDEIMRIFQTIGVAEEVEAVSRINAGMRFVDPEGKLILDWPRPQEVGPQGWYPSYRFHQPDLDRILRARLAEWRNVQVHLGREAVMFRHTADGIAVSDLDRESITARYVVGCDGGRSTIRGQIGGQTEDLGFHERWLVADLIMAAERPDLGDFTIQHCHPERAITQVRGPGLRRRWEIALRGESDEQALEPGYLWDRLARWISPGEAEIERAAVYTFHSVIAGRWRNNRILLAGDAAHQTPPFMGQGMCAGIRDAANLAWKLAHCVRHGHDDAVLESYQSERHPHVRAFIQGAVNLGRLINATDAENALKDAFRQPDGSYRMASAKPRLGPGLWQDVSTAAGWLSPQARFRSDKLSDEVTGYRPALIARSGVLTEDVLALTSSRCIQIITPRESPECEGWLADWAAKAVLTRPDRYIYGLAQDGDELVSLLKAHPL